MLLAHYSVEKWVKTEGANINIRDYSHLILTKMSKTHTGEKNVSSTNSAGVPHIEK